MLLSYLVFKQPLPPNSCGKSLNELFLQDEPDIQGEDIMQFEQDNADQFSHEAEKHSLNMASKSSQKTDSKATKEDTIHIKSLTPTSDQLMSLNLQPGTNTISF